MTDQSGIVRRPDFAGGGITEEERERIAAHSALWIQRAFRTEPADPRLIEEAIKGLYSLIDYYPRKTKSATRPESILMCGQSVIVASSH